MIANWPDAPYRTAEEIRASGRPTRLRLRQPMPSGAGIRLGSGQAAGEAV